LHLRGRKQDACAASAEGHAADVVDRGSRRTGHHPDSPRLGGQGALALLREQSFARELRLQPFQRLEERPASGLLKTVDDELDPSPRGPERGAAAYPNACSVDAELTHPRGHVRTVRNDLDPRLFALVLEAKVQMSARRLASVGDLALDPYRLCEFLIENCANRAIELSHTERARLGIGRFRRPRREVEGQAAIFGHRADVARSIRGTRRSRFAVPVEVDSVPVGVEMPASFRKVLVANRGEIAVRVSRTLHEMGIGVVAVHSEADRASLHVRVADEAYPIGPAPASESYLRVDRIVDVARRAGCDAIHPGYGFLSENPALPEACAAAGVTFIGPPASAMRAMGSKTSARDTMAAAGVPIVPGARCETADDALAAATAIGFPVMLKAAHGGGGKGMRLVESPEGMRSAWDRARSEAKKFFGNDTVYLEKAIVRPRHVEIQVLGDQSGNTVHIFERDCSIQRRNQKVVEETPSPAASSELVARMGAIAVRGAQSVGYFSAGTFEFLLAEDGSFYFLEMNTRLQVEHPVTELVTGLDLVREMVRVAQGEPLGFGQEELTRRGASIECRVYAEDPVSFLPSPGVVRELVVPSGPGVRDDSGAYPGCTISSYYDPLISKLSVWAPTRERAVARMRRALSEYVVTGIRTNLAFHDRLLSHPEFAAGRYDTGFIERHRDALLGPGSIASTDREALAVALAFAAAVRERAAGSGSPCDARIDGSTFSNPSTGGLSPWVARHRARFR
jgi:acetyl-CoA carboxylase, biotin carboxylase subunit